MKLPRPHTPLSVRLAVAARQVRENPIEGFPLTSESLVMTILTSGMSARAQLKALLAMLRKRLGGDADSVLELHHDPALMNREKITIAGVIIGYKPDANDHRYLRYMIEADHDVVTRVRGEGAQLSDQGQQRKLKRIAAKRAPKGIVAIVGNRPKKNAKRLPRGRKLRSANRWPPRGSRRMQWSKPQ